MTARITVIGSANVDYIMQVPELPAVGETVLEGSFLQTFGGKGANQAVAAARAGGATTLVAALGDDAVAQTYRQHLADEGIDLQHVSMEPDVPGGSALVMFDRNGDNYLTVAPGANARVTPQRVREAEAAVASCDWLLLQREVPTPSNREALRLAADHGQPAMLNYAPAHRLDLVPDAAIHALVVNEHEAAALLDQPVNPSDPARCEKQAVALRERGRHRVVVITLGGAGAVYADANDRGHAAAFEIHPVDATAAGDTFCGVLAVALAEGQGLAPAVRFASAAAALTVTRAGAQPSIPNRREIEALANDD
jgi:ribokinase